MTQIAYEVPRPRTGLDELRGILTAGGPTEQHRLWQLLQDHHAEATTQLAHISSPLTRVLRRAAEPDRALARRRVHAADLLSGVQRGLVHARATLAGLADQDPRPIAVHDAGLLLYPAHLALTRMDLVPDEVTTAKMARAAVAAFADALRAPR